MSPREGTEAAPIPPASLQIVTGPSRAARALAAGSGSCAAPCRRDPAPGSGAAFVPGAGRQDLLLAKWCSHVLPGICKILDQITGEAALPTAPTRHKDGKDAHTPLNARAAGQCAERGLRVSTPRPGGTGAAQQGTCCGLGSVPVQPSPTPGEPRGRVEQQRKRCPTHLERLAPGTGLGMWRVPCPLPPAQRPTSPSRLLGESRAPSTKHEQHLAVVEPTAGMAAALCPQPHVNLTRTPLR